VGVGREGVRSSRRDRPAAGLEHLTVDGEWSSTVVSVSGASGVTLHRVSGDPHELLEFPPELAAALPSRPGHASLHVSLQGDGAVTGGAHIDATARTLDLWEVDYHQDLQLDAQRWPGWRVEHHGDRFEEHIARTGGALHVEPPSQGLAVEQLTAYLLRTPSFDPRELLASIQKRHEGSEIEVNPLFLSHAPLRLDEEERASILARALAGLPLLPGFAP
jgi:hypothetical protein